MPNRMGYGPSSERAVARLEALLGVALSDSLAVAATATLLSPALISLGDAHRLDDRIDPPSDLFAPLRRWGVAPVPGGGITVRGWVMYSPSEARDPSLSMSENLGTAGFCFSFEGYTKSTACHSLVVRGARVTISASTATIC